MQPYLYPQVVGHTPGNLDIRVPLDSQIKIEFSRDINPNSIHTDTFMVVQGGMLVLGKYEYHAKTREAVFIPNNNLKPGVKYQVIVVGDLNSEDSAKTILDVLDNPLQNNYTFSFTTTEEIDLEAPDIISPVHQSIIDNLYFEWTEIDGAISYDIEISDNKLFETLVYKNKTYGTSLEVNDLELDKEYFVRVMAISEDKHSDWSKQHAFYYEKINQDYLGNNPIEETENIEVKLIYPEEEINVDVNLKEIVFEINQKLEEGDIEVVLQGVSINQIPYIQSHGVRNGVIEIIEQGPNYTRIRYVI